MFVFVVCIVATCTMFVFLYSPIKYLIFVFISPLIGQAALKLSSELTIEKQKIKDMADKKEAKEIIRRAMVSSSV